jgi:acetaldehyde dehydrogenase/alcohol dehydrogenase
VIDPETGFMRPMAVGQKAADIARFIGLRVEPNTKLLIAPIQGVGPAHPLSVEKLFPVLSVYRAKSVDEALKVCVDVNHAGGIGHTAVVFSRNDEIIRKFSQVINAGRIIVNSPGSIGAIGGVYNDMVPTLSFGCGTGGGNSTMDNVSVYNYLNIKRVARRTQAPMWFRVPNQIYFNMNAVECLRQFPSRSTIIVTNPVWSKSAMSALCGGTFHCKPPSMSPSSPRRSRKSKPSCKDWRRSISIKRTRSLRWAAGP